MLRVKRAQRDAARSLDGLVEHFTDTLDTGVLAALTDAACATARYGRPLSRGEAGCFLSHRTAWDTVARSGAAAIVLEDDALLDDGFFERVLPASADALSACADIVLLGRAKLARRRAAPTYLHEPLKRARRIGPVCIGVPFKQWTSGAVGYWISASGASKALAHTGVPIGALLDDWPWHRTHGGLRVAELRPYVVWEAFETMPSALEAERAALSSRRHVMHDAALKPLRIARTAYRWLTVAMLAATASRGKLFAPDE
ncbi:glycosyltransferase [Paraburkholderia sp. Se-20369]|nr:glycosyltransferase [Paraburkholderia sp. Se-20369]